MLNLGSIIRNRIGHDKCIHLPALHRWEALHAHAAAGAIRVVVVGDAQAVAASDAAVLRVSERDGMIRRWLQAAGCHGALVRPDHYVFGAFATVDEAEILLKALARAGDIVRRHGARTR